ncbi:hypothetical protein Tco_0454024 [Tanacetum coccineum]
MQELPQQNWGAERMNRTLLEAARDMIADITLALPFLGRSSHTACFTFNRVRVGPMPQNKTIMRLLLATNQSLATLDHLVLLLLEFKLRHQESGSNLHVNFLEEKPNVQGLGHRWMFDLDYLTDSMNYIPVSLQNQANHAGSKEVSDIDVQTEETEELLVVSFFFLDQQCSVHYATKKSLSSKKPSSTPISKSADDIMVFRKELDALALKHLGPVPTSVPTSTDPVNTVLKNETKSYLMTIEMRMPEIRIYDYQVKVFLNKLLMMTDGVITDFHNLPDEFEPRKVSEALEDGSWVEAMQEELLQFKLQQVWVLVDLPTGAMGDGTKGFTETRKDERGVFSEQARLVAQRHRQEKGLTMMSSMIGISKDFSSQCAYYWLSVEKSEARSTWMERKCQKVHHLNLLITLSSTLNMKPEIQASISSENLGTAILQNDRESQKLENKLRRKEKPDSAQVNTAQVNTAQVNTAELNPDSTPSAQVNTGEINAAEVNTGEAERVQRRKGKARRLVEQEEEAAREALATEFDYIQARLNADQILAEKIQQEEREQYSIEERAKTQAPNNSQLRNQMITYLKHVANKKHAELKSKSFEEIQVLYERYKKQDQTFVAIGSEEDERAIKD